MFILADDLGWANLGSYGQRFYETPKLGQALGVGSLRVSERAQLLDVVFDFVLG